MKKLVAAVLLGLMATSASAKSAFDDLNYKTKWSHSYYNLSCSCKVRNALEITQGDYTLDVSTKDLRRLRIPSDVPRLVASRAIDEILTEARDIRNKSLSWVTVIIAEDGVILRSVKRTGFHSLTHSYSEKLESKNVKRYAKAMSKILFAHNHDDSSEALEFIISRSDGSHLIKQRPNIKKPTNDNKVEVNKPNKLNIN